MSAQAAVFFDYVVGFGAYQPDSNLLHGASFLKRVNSGKLVEGMPSRPHGYERFVKKPIGATIIGAGTL